MATAGFAGTHVAVVTPMRPGGEIDWQAWSRLVTLHRENGTDGLVVCGTTGESPTISDAELRELVQRALSQAAGRLRILAGVGTNSTAATVARVREFSQLDVDGLLLVTPAYNRPTQEGLYRHFEAAAAASTKPVILYNVPGRTAVDLLPETAARLAQLPRIVALKEAVDSMQRIRDLKAQCPAHFQILSGDDATAREAVAAGASGVISVTANVAPAQMSAMIAAALRGDHALATQLDARLAGLHRQLFVEANPIPVKWALQRMGLMDGALRLPLTELSERYHESVAAALRQADIPLAAAA
ncbi:MAG TPA: 4-hydroxy-tetrahydrodipicolinate synthase [Steroidobacteraceae bacterium]|nr:4-hydroxy-tetrahydrodipicolinate synthase [Steroidobacteraceae bacterium]